MYRLINFDYFSRNFSVKEISLLVRLTFLKQINPAAPATNSAKTIMAAKAVWAMLLRGHTASLKKVSLVFA